MIKHSVAVVGDRTLLQYVNRLIPTLAEDVARAQCRVVADTAPKYTKDEPDNLARVKFAPLDAQKSLKLSAR